ncbi:MAG: alpha/beta hydrolase-fold protein [Planctomycetota bacterium]
MLHRGAATLLVGLGVFIVGCSEPAARDGAPTEAGDDTASTASTDTADAPAAGSTEPTAQPEGAADASPRMVRPEALEQGFLIIVDDPARIATASDPITIGSIWGGWDPSREGYEMEPRSDGRWQLELNGNDQNGSFAWKFTRGEWETVEMTSAGEQVENRTLPEIDASAFADGSRPVFEFTIEKWMDQLPRAVTDAGLEDVTVPLRVTGRAERVQIPGGGGSASGMEPRDAIVWLPPEYDDPRQASRVFPVLYLLDGQNLFYRPEGVPPAEWGVDEAATRLIASGEMGPTVIVGIPHAGEHRMAEYLPLPDVLPRVEPGAAGFVDFLEYTVMPRIESRFRVRSDGRGRSIGGASLGGIAAMYAATDRPALFAGGALIESPSLLLGGGEPLQAHFMAQNVWPERVYLGIGGRETPTGDVARNEAYVAAIRELGDHIASRGSSVRVSVVNEHTHNEAAWGERLDESLPFVAPGG